MSKFLSGVEKVEKDSRLIFLILAFGLVTASSAATLIELTDAPALTVAAYRMVFASVILAPIAFTFYREEITGLDRKTALFIAFVGVFLAVHFATWIKSLDYIPVPDAILLTNSSPIFVALLSYVFLNEGSSKREVAGIMTAILGMGLIVYPKISQYVSLIGSLLAVMAAVAFSGYLVSSRDLRQKYSLVPFIFLVYSASAVTLGVASGFIGVPLTGFGGNVYFLMFLIGLVPTVLGHTTFNWSLEYLRATVVSVSMLTLPVLASLMAWIVLGEVPTTWTFVGGAFILGGIYLAGREG